MNSIFKWFNPIINTKPEKSAKMDAKNNSNSQSFKKLVIFAILIVFCAVIYNYYLLNGELFNDVKQSSDKKQPKNDEIKHGFPSTQTKPVQKKIDFSSTAKFLEETKSLTLEDFEPINNESGEELKLSDISKFNNLQLGPRIQSIVQKDYFKFVKLNLQRGCTLWPDNSKCSLKDCSIQFCDESQLPKSLIFDEINDNEKTVEGDECPSDSPQKLSEIDRTVSSDHIEAMNTLFDCTEDDHEGAQYYDLLLNPERFTGYSGETSHRIWRSIYEENCFLKKQSNPFSLDSLCYEERIFYRAISGLHTSINIHLSALYHMIDGNFAHNTKEFVNRFHGKYEYIKNLFFLYLIELRALHKSEPYLLNKVNWQSSGDQSLTKEAIKDLLRTVRKFKWHFNESILFKQQPATVAQEFSQHFSNITTNIMDCVSCDRCRLWGKVQTHGLGTAIKILLVDDIEKLKLNRHEIICLVNGLARLSNSIAQIDVFKQLLSNYS